MASVCSLGDTRRRSGAADPVAVRRMVGAATAAVLLLSAAAPRPAAAQEIEDLSYTAPDGTRVLRQRIVVPAGLEEVWAAFTTAEGLMSWAVPFARVDFRLGGDWESSYDPEARAGDGANIRNRYISFLPMRMISIQAVQAPPGFSHPELLPELFTVIELEAVGSRAVAVTVSGVGYRDGPAYETLYRHFERGNAWSLRQLRRRFVEGPVDWVAALRGGRQ